MAENSTWQEQWRRAGGGSSVAEEERQYLVAEDLETRGLAETEPDQAQAEVEGASVRQRYKPDLECQREAWKLAARDEGSTGQTVGT